MAFPLHGKRILITRAREQAPVLAELFAAEGAEVVSIPTIEIRPPQSFNPLDDALRRVPSYDWLILTSVNGVRALERRMARLEIDAGLLRRLSVAAIGPATSQAATQLGLKVVVTPTEYVAEAVVSALRDRVRGQKVLLIRAKVARDVIPKELRAAGAEVDVVEAYETTVPAHSGKRLMETLSGEQRPHLITFTSSSTARNFIALLPKGMSPRELLHGIHLASIGPVTSKTLREVGLWVDIEAKDYTMPGLVEAVKNLPG